MMIDCIKLLPNQGKTDMKLRKYINSYSDAMQNITYITRAIQFIKTHLDVLHVVTGN